MASMNRSHPPFTLPMPFRILPPQPKPSSTVGTPNGAYRKATPVSNKTKHDKHEVHKEIASTSHVNNQSHKIAGSPASRGKQIQGQVAVGGSVTVTVSDSAQFESTLANDSRYNRSHAAPIQSTINKEDVLLSNLTSPPVRTQRRPSPNRSPSPSVSRASRDYRGNLRGDQTKFVSLACENGGLAVRIITHEPRVKSSSRHSVAGLADENVVDEARASLLAGASPISLSSSPPPFIDPDVEFPDPDSVSGLESESVVTIRFPTLIVLILMVLFAMTIAADYYTTRDKSIASTEGTHSFALMRSGNSRQARTTVSLSHRMNDSSSNTSSTFQHLDTTNPRRRIPEEEIDSFDLGSGSNAISYLSTPALIRATTPTGATNAGMHVPCVWLEQAFGSAKQFAHLRTLIQDAISEDPSKAGHLTGTLIQESTNSTESESNIELPSFIPSEVSESRHFLDSVGIYCQPQVIQDECDMNENVGTGKPSNIRSQSGAMNLTSHELNRLHAWFRTLPEVRTYEAASRDSSTAKTSSSISFNVLTGAVATLSCRSMVRYGAPFAAFEQPSIYVEPNFNVLPNEYSSFISKRCAREVDEEKTQSKSGPAQTSHSTQNETVAKNHTKWAEPLLPLLPPVCSLASFTRPSLARSCLRNSRIIAFGDSTTQELMLQLIDFLETEDGEDPNDLTRMRVKMDGTRQSNDQNARDWVPRTAGSDGQTQYYFLEHWTPPDGCYRLNIVALMARHFTTARFPSPYLAAYNITVTMRWNVATDPCLIVKGPDRASDLDMYRASYRWLRESCLPANAVAIANKFRRNSTGTLLTSSQYVEAVNKRFHNYAHDGLTKYEEEPPSFGCSFPYLSDDEANQLTIAEWHVHLSRVPGFDYALLNMGAHFTETWGNLNAQRDVADGYTFTPKQFRQSVEAHLDMVQALSRNVIMRECSWRSDPLGQHIPTLNEILREVTIEAQARALQRDRETVRLLAIARQTTNSSKQLTNLKWLVQSRRTVSWLPTFFTTAMLEKTDVDHCSFKNAGPERDGINGMRSPFCYSIIQDIIQLMCQANAIPGD